MKIIKISSCTECPHFRSIYEYTPDPWRCTQTWLCEFISPSKTVQRWVEEDDDLKFIPKDCPLDESKDN